MRESLYGIEQRTSTFKICLGSANTINSLFKTLSNKWML